MFLELWGCFRGRFWSSGGRLGSTFGDLGTIFDLASYEFRMILHGCVRRKSSTTIFLKHVSLSSCFWYKLVVRIEKVMLLQSTNYSKSELCSIKSGPKILKNSGANKKRVQNRKRESQNRNDTVWLERFWSPEVPGDDRCNDQTIQNPILIISQCLRAKAWRISPSAEKHPAAFS